MVHSTYQARRPIKIGTEYRQPGELVPEAGTWFRVQHLIHSGRLVAVVVEDDTFVEAVEKFCPELADTLTKEINMEDLAAKRALKRQEDLAKSPGEVLQESLAAPPNNLDPSRSDQEAAAALRAASVTVETEKAVAERQAAEAKARKRAPDVDVKPVDEIEVKGAHKEFVSDQVPDDQKVEHASDEPALTQEEAEKAAKAEAKTPAKDEKAKDEKSTAKSDK